jgi:hypothetical protein
MEMSRDAGSIPAASTLHKGLREIASLFYLTTSEREYCFISCHILTLYGFLCQLSLVRYLLASSGKRPSNMMAKWFNASFQVRTGIYQTKRATRPGWLFCVSVGLIRYHIGLTGGIFQVPLMMEGVCSFGQ